ncbi:hypothetical protein B0H63DRAFT_541596 [Podospora didyma]|uniref:C2H2-type domain-containing protein n=1 Tax=Podospora didyma TaxID=330526 RepID=A0AAE0NTQ9_9PEZI|nr:hypothetical protein B0H63DRAFT_541596 [Podospora didyma]
MAGTVEELSASSQMRPARPARRTPLPNAPGGGRTPLPDGPRGRLSSRGGIAKPGRGGGVATRGGFNPRTNGSTSAAGRQSTTTSTSDGDSDSDTIDPKSEPNTPQANQDLDNGRFRNRTSGGPIGRNFMARGRGSTGRRGGASTSRTPAGHGSGAVQPASDAMDIEEKPGGNDNAPPGDQPGGDETMDVDPPGDNGTGNEQLEDDDMGNDQQGGNDGTGDNQPRGSGGGGGTSGGGGGPPGGGGSDDSDDEGGDDDGNPGSDEDEEEEEVTPTPPKKGKYKKKRQAGHQTRGTIRIGKVNLNILPRVKDEECTDIPIRNIFQPDGGTWDVRVSPAGLTRLQAKGHVSQHGLTMDPNTGVWWFQEEGQPNPTALTYEGFELKMATIFAPCWTCGHKPQKRNGPKGHLTPKDYLAWHPQYRHGYRCPICGAWFIRSIALLKHRQNLAHFTQADLNEAGLHRPADGSDAVAGPSNGSPPNEAGPSNEAGPAVADPDDNRPDPKYGKVLFQIASIIDGSSSEDEEESEGEEQPEEEPDDGIE